MWANKLCNCPTPGRSSVDRSLSEWPGIWWHRRGPRPPCSLSGKVNKKAQVGGARGNWRRVLGLRHWEQAEAGRTQEPGGGLCQDTEFELWETLKGIYLNYVTSVAYLKLQTDPLKNVSFIHDGRHLEAPNKKDQILCLSAPPTHTRSFKTKCSTTIK